MESKRTNVGLILCQVKSKTNGESFPVEVLFFLLSKQFRVGGWLIFTSFELWLDEIDNSSPTMNLPDMKVFLKILCDVKVNKSGTKNVYKENERGQVQVILFEIVLTNPFETWMPIWTFRTLKRQEISSHNERV